MGKRLSRIVTRTGDTGSTGLSDGSRIDKDHPRIEAIGTLDELNSHLGLLLTTLPSEHPVSPWIITIQHDLFDLGGELACPGHQLFPEKVSERLEHQLEQLNNTMPALEEFILPGGKLAASQAHICRTVCRRAERTLITLNRETEINPQALISINRLSDWLFIVARFLARENGGRETLWNRQRTAQHNT